ncbi:MAG: hypothetical protein EBT61_17905, partial [Verrucomicrobia bacterium]|nr:hypothetical protein [Verrucomicrobiota bacterium]
MHRFFGSRHLSDRTTDRFFWSSALSITSDSVGFGIVDAFPLIPAFSRWEKEGRRPPKAFLSPSKFCLDPRSAPRSRTAPLSQRERARVRESGWTFQPGHNSSEVVGLASLAPNGGEGL